MKIFRIVLFLVILIFSVSGFSEEITIPGGSKSIIRTGLVLGENLIGPRKVVFSGMGPGIVVPALSKEETNSSGNATGSFDRLLTLFSGKIYSPGISEPFIFENKTPEEFVQMETIMFPDYLEQPYTLFLNLTVQVASHPKNADVSDDAGEYGAAITVTLTQL